MTITFPQSACDYLIKHKGAAGPAEIDAQVARSARLLDKMRPILDRYQPGSILDIGCGLGLSATMVAQAINAHYLGLMDGDGTGELFSDYRTDAPAWNDVRIAGELARANLYSGCKVETFVQDPAATIPVDMIMSVKSWATHYPARTYIDLAVRSLNPGGVVVIDLRPGDEIFRAAQRAIFVRAGFEVVEQGERRHVFERRG